MYSVNIEGGDPFIAKTRSGILANLELLHGGEQVYVSEYGKPGELCNTIDITWRDNVGEKIDVKATWCEVVE